MPRALRAIHDAPGESGFSPYELVFGRHRPLANLPYTPEREAEEAKDFFSKMEEMRTRAAEKLNTDQGKRCAGINRNRKEMPMLRPGTTVWYKPEPQPGRDKLEPPWKGPYILAERVGDHSYILELPTGGAKKHTGHSYANIWRTLIPWTHSPYTTSLERHPRWS